MLLEHCERIDRVELKVSVQSQLCEGRVTLQSAGLRLLEQEAKQYQMDLRKRQPLQNANTRMMDGEIAVR